MTAPTGTPALPRPAPRTAPIARPGPGAQLLGALLALIVLSAPAPAPAGAGTGDPAWRLQLYWENDGTFAKPNNPTDRYYTNGTGLSLTWRPDWAHTLAEALPGAPGDGPARSAFGLVAGQKIFTPEDIEARRLIRNDRPYAGYLFGGAFLQRDDGATFDQARLELGVVGPSSLADDTQAFIHEVFDDVDPKGWENQLADEPAVQLNLRRKWRFGTGFTWGRWHLGAEAIPEVGLAVGSVHRHVEAGLMLRAGPRLPDDAGPGRLDEAASFTATPGRTWFYGFGRIAGRAVEHDLFLDGGTFESGHAVGSETLVGRGTLGLTFGHAAGDWHIEVSYAQTFITRQFEGQDGAHAFGRWTLSFQRSF